MIDLHSHSTVSDGTDPPADVVALGAAARLSALALTDHDTLDHLPEARAAAAEHGIRLVSGCEISCELDGRDDRNQQIVEQLRADGVDVTLDEVLAEAGEGSVGRPHIARVLLRKGYVSSIQEAFDRWLAKGRPAYFERVRLTPEESIDLAHASGGVTVMAHPSSVELEGAALDAFVGGLAATGLDGLECLYGRYSPDERSSYRDLADRHRLAVTGGSDYHGDNKPDLRIGTGRGDLAVPDELLDALEARRP